MTQNSTKTVFDLPAKLDADAAPALVAELKNMDRSGEVVLNAATVTALSPGYLQILISAFKTFPQMTVSDASAVFVEAFALCGLAYPISSGVQDAAEPHSASIPDESLKAAAAAPPDEPPSAVGPVASAATAEAPSAAVSIALAEEPASAVPLVPSDEPQGRAGPAALAALPGESVGAAPAGEPPSATGTQAEPDTLPASDAATPKTILTIDDSRTMRDMLKMALGGAGFTVLQAVDGQDGLNVLARQPVVDLIITDINMPKLDGYGVIRAVRKDPTYNETPILVLSTEGEQESKDIAKDAGATGWIVKPFDPDGLVKIVNTVCG